MAGAATGGPDPSPRIAAALGNARRIGLAVSGGGDSMALLDLALAHAARTGAQCHAVTVDHGLRPDAAAEVAMVAETCAAAGISHDVLHWHWDGTGNLQAAARAARYALMAEWARAKGLDLVALGHTQDDVAESLLLRLRRAPGVDGLAEMPRRFQRDGVTFVRPLLDISRSRLRDHLRERGKIWAEDPSNGDPRFDRVRARQLLDTLGPLGVTSEALAATSRHLSDAREALDAMARRERTRVVREDRGDLILTDAADDLPPEIARRVLIAALCHVAGRTDAPRQSTLEEMRAALGDGAAAHVLHGCRVTPETTGLRIAREAAAVAELRCPTTGLWDGRWRLDGPHDPAFTIRALGEAIALCPWRQTGLPRASLMAGPAIWEGAVLVAAPLAGLERGWRATADGRGKFADLCHHD